MIKTMFHYFPDIINKLSQIKDIRKRPHYSISEIIFAAIAMSIFKASTRNAFNNYREEIKFEKNYFKAFGLRLPHMDTVHLILNNLDNNELEQLKYHLVSTLIEKKIFYKFRICSQYYNIVFDGTGVMTIKEANVKNFPNAVHTTSKNGVVTYFIKVLEAKLVTSSGFVISIGTEWIENEGEYDKQDCETK
ncbi:MAG: transposase family protein, partial [Oligoflexia bacterium]|nr:transposase family protein [Oligoflexia bacterium]